MAVKRISHFVAQLVQHRHEVLDTTIVLAGADAMQMKDVDVVGAEALQALLDLGLVFGRRHEVLARFRRARPRA